MYTILITAKTGIAAFSTLIVLEVVGAAIGLIGKMSQRETASPMALNIHSLMRMVSGSKHFFVTLQKKIAFYARTHFRNIAGHRFGGSYLHRVC